MKWYKHDPNAALAGMMGLTVEERGAYYTLIDVFYERDGHVPDDDYLMSRILGCNPRTWRRLKLALFQKQKVTVTDGLLVPNRGEYTLNEARMFSERQANRARTRWERTGKVNKNNNPAMPLAAMPLQPQPQPQPDKKDKNKSPSDSPPTLDLGLQDDSPRNARASVRKNPYPKEFEEFYARYPLHTGKDAALKAWERVTEQGKATKDELIAGATRYRNDPNRDDSYTKHPATWLNAGCHNDGPLPARGNGHGRVMTYKDKRQEELEDVKRALKASIARADDERESDQDDRPTDGVLPLAHRSRS
jgi:uncharacterized protein YdaU (DUF1376 family)